MSEDKPLVSHRCINIPNNSSMIVITVDLSGQRVLGDTEKRDSNSAILVTNDRKRQRPATPARQNSVTGASRRPTVTLGPTHVPTDKKNIQVIDLTIMDGETPAEPEEKRAKMSCSICLENLGIGTTGSKSLASTICGHVFCKECLRASLTRRSVCPLCRKRLRGATAWHPIYFQ